MTIPVLIDLVFKKMVLENPVINIEDKKKYSFFF